MSIGGEQPAPPSRKRRGGRARYGTGTIRPRPGGGWEIRWRENGRQRSQVINESRDTAARVLAKHVGEVADRGRSSVPIAPRKVPTLAQLADEFLKRRELTHPRSVRVERGRWVNHLKVEIGHLRPTAVNTGVLRQVIENRLASGASSTTVGLVLKMLSVLFSDLVEREIVQDNPVKRLPKSARKLMRPALDAKDIPWLKRAEDIRAVFLALPEPYNIAFALGSMAGLRIGEALALQWPQVDEAAGLLYIRESTGGPLKDKESRVVPIMDPLRPVLAAWRLKTGGRGLVVPPSRGRFLDDHGLGTKLREALKACGLWIETDTPGQRLNFHRAGRHTFASSFVSAGGSLERLRQMCGWSSYEVALRYAHLLPGSYSAADRARIAVDLSPATGDVIPLRPGAVEGQLRDRGRSGRRNRRRSAG